MQLGQRQFGLKVGCVTVVEVNVASSCNPQAHMMSGLQWSGNIESFQLHTPDFIQFHFQTCLQLRATLTKATSLEGMIRRHAAPTGATKYLFFP